MTEVEALVREARAEFIAVRSDARERWGHIDGMDLDQPSYYQDLLTRLSDALEALEQENTALKQVLQSEILPPVNISEAQRLLQAWQKKTTAIRFAGEDEMERAKRAAERAYDELIDYVESNGLNFSEYDPRHGEA